MEKKLTLIWFTAVSLFLVTASMVLPESSYAESVGLSNPGEPSINSFEVQPPTLSRDLPDLERFEVAFDGTAVLDNKTGVVWEKSPDPTMMSWQEAINHCANLELAGEEQWHLPTFDELASLVDDSNLGSPKLPSAHPFDTGCKLGGCVQSDSYWSATTSAENAVHARLICFCNGSERRSNKKFENFAWCSRVEKGEVTD